ncbi:MAG: ABC transporter substrate-binding protein [Melioribacteraceae bacterium]|nr:ABC transporter substrate-binding protein [Melioribacteraceae bacterium]
MLEKFKITLVLISILFSTDNLKSQEKLTSITLQLKWKHQFQFAGYYAAIEKGFYKEAGIEVTLKEGTVNTDVYSEVLFERADFSISSSTIVTERTKGKPLVVLANIFQHSPEVLLVRGDSGINSFHDLIGKRIMINPELSIPVSATLRKEGLSEDNVTIVESDYNFENLINNNVDAMAAYLTDQPFILLEKKIPYRILNPVAYGVDFYGDCLFTSEKFIKENPVVTKNFLEATLKGWKYAMNNRVELIDIILAKYGSDLSKERLQFEAEAMVGLIVPNFIDIGHVNPGRWDHIADTFVEFGIIEKGYDIVGLIYNPNPKPDYRLYFTIGLILLTIIVIGVIGTIILLRFNTRLQDEVKVQTAELNEAKEKAEKSELLKTEFLAQMSHEIRSPINTILSFATLIKDEISAQSNDWDDLFESMESAGQRIIRTIDLLLNMSEIQTGSYEVNPRKLKLYEDVILKIYREYKIEAERKNLEFTVKCEGRCGYVFADEYSISQVFANLIDNSIKYTEKGRIDICCSINEFNQAVVKIVDSGIGISAEYLPKLFNTFTQEEQGYTRSFEGNGLGLALVKNYCDINKAEIRVESQKGKGSTFIVTIQEAV